jgi:polar amino acid transport system substrate-binding protein
VDDLPTVVVTTMPRCNPGSLSPQQYPMSFVYLLAADCYPAGGTPFPTKSTSQIQKVKLQALPGLNRLILRWVYADSR